MKPLNVFIMLTAFFAMIFSPIPHMIGYWIIISFGVIPQILPSFVANNLYILDRNVRMATMLGIVGAGGIGYELQSSFRMFEYERVSAIIILIFVTIFIIDHLSAFIRSKIK